LVNAFKVENKLQIESAIKEDSLFIERQRTITLKNKKYVELLNMDGLALSVLDKTIKNIIKNIEFSPENYIKILNENKLLKKELYKKNEIKYNSDFALLNAENKRLKMDNLKLIRKYNTLKKKTVEEVEDSEEQEQPKEEIENYGILVNNVDKYFIKNKDGTYKIRGKTYNKLYGSREDVWNSKAYKTSGGLIKSDFIINISGKIVSKKKSIVETINKRLVKCQVNKESDLPFLSNDETKALFE